jgi:DnaK suppressor protein
MPPEERKSQVTMTAAPAAGVCGPRWRALLEARWQARVREITELSLAYHTAAAARGNAGDGAAAREAQALLGRTVAARRRLADVEEALGRLASGRLGSCEQCGSAIPVAWLATAPETRYCPRCAAEPAGLRPGAERPPR